MKSKRGQRSIQQYLDTSKPEGLTEEQIIQLYNQITVEPTKSPKYKNVIQAIKKLSEEGLKEQENAHEVNDLMTSEEDIVVKQAMLLNKMGTVMQVVALMLDNGGQMQEVCDALILLKCYTDVVECFKVIDKSQLMNLTARILKMQQKEEDVITKIQTINIYILYNVFRYQELLKIGDDDVIMSQVVVNDIYEALMDLALQNRCGLEEETIITIAEALAAISDTEAFMDYISECLHDHVAKLFIVFYDTYVIPLLEDPESRGKMLCYDDVLSWIRRERPEVEEE